MSDVPARPSRARAARAAAGVLLAVTGVVLVAQLIL
jgi:hypothetical protein